MRAVSHSRATDLHQDTEGRAGSCRLQAVVRREPACAVSDDAEPRSRMKVRGAEDDPDPVGISDAI